MTVASAVARVEAGLSEDPRREVVGGEEGPRDLLFTRRVVEWIRKLTTRTSDVLLLAAWGHVLGRWKLPRDTHPKTTAGYHKWRRAQSALSAEEVEKILAGEGVDRETQARARDLILKKNFPVDPESQVLEDADCLAFIELKLENYLTEWDEIKLKRILTGTLEKMSPTAREQARKIIGQKFSLNREILDKILSISL